MRKDTLMHSQFHIVFLSNYTLNFRRLDSQRYLLTLIISLHFAHL